MRISRSALVIALASLVVACGGQPGVQIPMPDLDGAEAEVVEAVEEARRGVEKEPGSARAWGQLGDRYRSGLWLADAARCYRRAEQIEPGEFRWPYLLGHSLMHWDPASAVEALSRALEIDSGYAPAHIVYAQRLLRLDRTEEARRHFEIARELVPDHPHAASGLGQLALASVDLDSARAYLEQAILHNPAQGDARRALAQVYLALGDETRAREQARIAESLPYLTPLSDPRAETSVEPAGSIAHLDRGKALMRGGDLEGATREYRKALQSDPDSSPAHYFLAVVLTQLERYDEAIDHLREVRRIQPDSTHYHNGMGQLRFDQGKRDQAAAHWLESLARDPHDAEIHYAMGDLMNVSGRPGEAIRHFRESLRLDPDRADVHHAVGALLNNEGRVDEAMTHLREAVRLKPDDAAIRFYFGTLLARRQMEAEAETQLTAAVRLDPANADAHVNLGILLMRQGRFAEAEAGFRAALQIRPDHGRARNGLASALKRQDK